MTQIARDIERAKAKLIKKAKARGGTYENFGQKEVRLLEDKYGYTPEVCEFDEWCSTYEG